MIRSYIFEVFFSRRYEDNTRYAATRSDENSAVAEQIEGNNFDRIEPLENAQVFVVVVWQIDCESSASFRMS